MAHTYAQAQKVQTCTGGQRCVLVVPVESVVSIFVASFYKTLWCFLDVEIHCLTIWCRVQMFVCFVFWGGGGLFLM